MGSSNNDDGKPKRSLMDVLGKRSALSTQPDTSGGSKRAKQPAQRDEVAGWKDLGQGCRIGFWPRLVPQIQHDECFQALMQQAHWRRCEIVLFGKPVMQPREICYMAEHAGLGYKYSGTEMIVEPFHETVARLKKLAEETSGDKYNSCLLNLYHHGQEYMGWHSDDETLYGKDAPICAVSLGQSRSFYLRKKADHAHKLEYCLGQGDVFVMKGATQTYWQHSVPKRTNVPSARISLTFRFVKYPVGRK